MKLIEMKCQRCSAILEIPDDATIIKCDYCGAKYALDDETIHHKLDDAEEIGYRLEKGKQRARREQLEAAQAGQEPKTDKTKSQKHWNLYKILVWVFLFPFTFSIWVWRREDAPKAAKIAIIILFWLLIILARQY